MSRGVLKVATFNIHMWTDAECVTNVERVLKLVQEHDPDVLCVQESTQPEQTLFREAVIDLYPYYLVQFFTAIFSKYPVEQPEERFKDHHVIGAVRIPEFHIPFYVTCLHLNHRCEEIRLKQIDYLRQVWQTLDQELPMLWAGDFNALSREEYSDGAWDQITKVREQNDWELPKTAVTTKIKAEFGFSDLWLKVGQPAPRGTCRFDTRIDYLFASRIWSEMFDCISVEHVRSDASDHKMVVATFTY